MQFGGLRALGDVSFDLMEGQIIGLIGPNGAGKTTLFNCLTGLYAPTSGSVSLRGERLPQDPALVTEKGIARTFQNIRLFPSMTAEENVLVGRHVRMKQSPLSSLLHGPKFKRSEAEARERSGELLNFVGLGRFSDELARNLPYGDQRRLEIARALATDPSVLLLDEPTAGMNAQETEATRQLIFAIRDLGVSVVVIEHDTKFIFTLCDRVLVLVQGELLVEGSPDEVRGDPRVIEAYLGAPPEEVEAQLHSPPPSRRESPTGGAHRREDSRELPAGPRPRRRLRRDPGGARRLVRRREGPDRQPDRQQRGGQDHHAAHDLGVAAVGVRRGAARRRADPPSSGARDRREGRGPQPGGPQAVLPDDRGGEPAAGRLHPQRRGRRSGRTWTTSTRSSRSWGSGA